MSLTAYPLTVTVCGSDGEPLTGAVVTAQLIDFQSGVAPANLRGPNGEPIFPEVVCETTDADGTAVLDLIPSVQVMPTVHWKLVAEAIVYEKWGGYTRRRQLLGIVDTLAMETDWETLNPVNPGPGDHQSYIIVGDTADVTLAQVNAVMGFMGNRGPVPAYTGMKYLSFLRPESEGAFRAIYLYAQGTPNTQNQIGAWHQQASPLTIGGTSHLILTSDGPLTPPVGYTLVLEVV